MLSRTLVDGGGDGRAAAAARFDFSAAPRSGTETTLADDDVSSAPDTGQERRDERVKLMEASDNADADRIADSAPKVVLM